MFWLGQTSKTYLRTIIIPTVYTNNKTVPFPMVITNNFNLSGGGLEFVLESDQVCSNAWPSITMMVLHTLKVISDSGLYCPQKLTINIL